MLHQHSSTNILYHGSTVHNLKQLTPFHRTTPGELEKQSVPASIYATDNPLAAVMFSFPWTSSDGVDIEVAAQNLTLVVPSSLEGRLRQSISIYHVDAKHFSRIDGVSQQIGNYWSQSAVPIIETERFSSVYDGVERYRGVIKILG